MALYPLRNPWWSRPGWSEWRDWRNGGPNHDGLDMYTRRGTAIYATGNGVVTGKGFHRPEPRVGHGHFIAIQFGNVEVSYSHMLAASPYALGARVDSGTRVGQVGDTGSAEGVDWVIGSPTGQPLQHVHVEVRLFGTLINPRIHFDSLTLAGTETTPITPPTTPTIPTVEEHNVKVYRRNEPTRQWMLIWPSLAGETTSERGFVVTSNTATSSQWERAFGEAEVLTAATYEGAQREARALHSAYRRGVILSVPSSGGSSSSDGFTTSDRTILTGIRDTLNRIFK